jgi:Methyltransferase FkbM domain
VQELSPSGKFDFIKFDIEGAEIEVFNDEASHPIICEAICFFMELHEWLREGSTASLHFFLRTGCGRKFAQVATTGEFLLFCQTGWADMSETGK